MARALILVMFTAALVWPRPAAAQVGIRYAEEPTGGLALPTTPLAGEHDARAVDANPGGLALLRGTELALAVDADDSAVATSAGQGFGAYVGTTVGGHLVPKLGLGLGLEWLRPPRAELSPDPGEPFRLTLACATGLGPNAGFGVAWHHFIADGALSGVDAFDLGLSLRLGAYLAVGGALRDLSTRAIGGTPVQRRYEVETVVRPLASDRLELAIGGRLGETREDVDGWARASLRVARGVYALGLVESRDVHELIDSPTGTTDRNGREERATLGVEVSFGQVGTTVLATGVRPVTGGNHALGGELVARASAVGPASVVPRRDHIERVELSGDIGVRELTQLVLRLREIARDPSAKALVVTFDAPSAGWATFEELRDEVLAVRRAGKKVFAYMVSGANKEYFVASAADRIYVDPAGGLRVTGIAATTLYFRGTLDLFGVVPEFEKIAEYKSAPEQLTETGPTPPAQKMHRDVYDSLWQRWVEAVADGRHLTAARVQELVDAAPYTAGDLAKSRELVDAVAPPDKVSELITSELHGVYSVERPRPDRPDRWARPGIAVVYVDGDISDGESKSVPVLGHLAGGQTLIAALQAARGDPRVGAIVLRIDSPGGSAVASELISREVFATRGVKPIVCSFSNLAASGGYFVAAGCDKIFAEPMTITGSIGIFAGKLDLSGLMHKLGITTDTYQHGKHADLESWYRPYDADERAVVMGQLRYMYSRFVGAVADGRKMSKDDVDKIGRGHVYTGTQALPIRLVDQFGGLGAAIDEAKQRMGLAADDKVDLYELPKQPANLLGTLGNLLGADAHALQPWDLPAVHAMLRDVPASLVVSPADPQARLPFQLVF
ncbi:MAG: signal peptide peptidase SppA [Acidobacteriota bacterium]